MRQVRSQLSADGQPTARMVEYKRVISSSRRVRGRSSVPWCDRGGRGDEIDYVVLHRNRTSSLGQLRAVWVDEQRKVGKLGRRPTKGLVKLEMLVRRWAPFL